MTQPPGSARVLNQPKHHTASREECRALTFHPGPFLAWVSSSTAANAAREAHLAKLRAEAGEAKAARDRLVAAVQEDNQARKGPGWKVSALHSSLDAV